MDILTQEQKDEIHELKQLRKYHREELSKIEEKLRSYKNAGSFSDEIIQNKIEQFLKENFIMLPVARDFDKKFTAEQYRATFKDINTVHGITVTDFYNLVQFYVKIGRATLKSILADLGIQTKSQCYSPGSKTHGQVLLGVFPNVESVLWDCLDPEEDTILIKWITEQRNG